MKLNHGTLTRSLIALLFVVAGFQKLMDFGNTVTAVQSFHVPMAGLATAIVIFIEIVVAIMFAVGYKTRFHGFVLIGFVVLVTVVVHGDLKGMNLVMALKNLAIVGGLMSAIGCYCADCTVHPKKKHHTAHTG
jgi:putative oxidoreductase